MDYIGHHDIETLNSAIKSNDTSAIQEYAIKLDSVESHKILLHKNVKRKIPCRKEKRRIIQEKKNKIQVVKSSRKNKTVETIVRHYMCIKFIHNIINYESFGQ